MSIPGSGLGSTVYVEPQFREGGRKRKEEGVERKSGMEGEGRGRGGEEEGERKRLSH